MMNKVEHNLILPETKEFLGIKPLRVFLPPERQPQNRLQTYFADKFLKTITQVGGTMVNDVDEANTIMFLVDLSKPDEGMFDYPKAFKNGVSGVAIAVRPEIPPETDMVRLTWETLGQAATQYGILIIGDYNSHHIEKVHTISMEGSHPEINFAELGEEVGMEEVAQRITHLAAAKKVTKWVADKTMPTGLWQEAWIPFEIMDAGRRLRKMGLLPDVKPEHYVSEERARRIKLFMEVSGLSIGNLSGWDNELRLMWITGSGFDKGNLKRDQVVAVSRFNDDFNGPVVWAPPDAAKVKPSVETFDQLLAYWASSLINAGRLEQPDLLELLAKIKDRQLLESVLLETGPIDRSIIHLHIEPESWDENIFTVLSANPQLVPKQAYHSSCGMRPLALYTTEELMRATLTTPNHTKVACLPNHGVFIASPLQLPELVSILDPEAGKIKFRQVRPK